MARGDRDFDGSPGNTADSRSFSRIYDPTGQQELSNLPEPGNYREAQRLIQAATEYQRQQLRDQADSGVDFFPSVGKFIVPTENTWASHARIVRNPDYGLAFNPEKFAFFDKIIADEYKNPALTDPTHRDYAKYEGLRTNLAVLRNDVIGMYLNDGSFDPGDEKFIPSFIQIASAIGQSLANDTALKRPFTQHMSVDVANVEGVGAREMYRHLLDLQAKPGSLRSILSHIRILNIPSRTWGLKPLEETPYSDANLSAPEAGQKIALTADELAAYCAGHVVPVENQMAAYSELALHNASSLNALQQLDTPIQEQAIEEARTILRWLKNLSFGDMDMQEWMSHGTPAERIAKAEAIARLTEIYALQLAYARHKNPDIEFTLPVEDANGAAGALAIGLAEHGLQGLPLDHPAALHLEKMAEHIPPNWAMFETASVKVLLDTLDEGLEYTSHHSLDPEMAGHRLLDIGNQIERTARKLRSVDTLEPPTREESVELAREILRRLRNMKLSDKTAKEMVDTGQPEEKTAFARNVASLVDVYSNLVEEAAETNPDILKDARIQEANDAVGTFSHTVKLMAAKEMPGSVAAAQQISADVTQMPEDWKHLHEHTVDRLLASVEGGLARAIEEVDLQTAQGQDQDEEMAQQAAASLLHDHHHRKRRRKKRYASAVGGMTKSSKRRNARDLNGDGVADQLQQLNLRGDDMIAVRQLGGNLRNLNDEATRLKIEIADPGAAVSPDDRGFSLRERDPRDPRNPNNRQRQ